MELFRNNAAERGRILFYRENSQLWLHSIASALSLERFLIFNLRGFSNSSAQYLDNFGPCFLDAFVVQWSPKRFKYNTIKKLINPLGYRPWEFDAFKRRTATIVSYVLVSSLGHQCLNDFWVT